MKDKIKIFILGLLLGALITTGAYYLYSINNITDCKSSYTEINSGQPPQMPNGQEPPEKPDGNNNPPSEIQNNNTENNN